MMSSVDTPNFVPPLRPAPVAPAGPAAPAPAMRAADDPVGPVARRLFPYRYLLLALYGSALAFGLWCFLLQGFDSGFVLRVAGGVALLLLLQAAFLSGAPHWRWPRPTRRRPMYLSLATGALVATLLSVGIVLTLVSLKGGAMADVMKMGPFLLLLPICAWGGWLAVFAALWARAPVVGFRRVYALLVAGSWLELLITVPVDAQVRKRTHCYCDEGSFFAMAIGISLAIWAFGPGLVLLFLIRRIQRRADLRVCLRCGYDLRGLSEPRCPECGQPFDPRLLGRPQGTAAPSATI